MKQCPECGQRRLRRFENESMTVEHGGVQTVVSHLAGSQCAACGEVLFDTDSAARYAAAGDALVLRAREHARKELRRIRVKLGLTQARASAITGGGPNAFSRYELGKAKPMPAVTHLLMLLDRHPELLREPEATASPSPATGASAKSRVA